MPNFDHAHPIFFNQLAKDQAISSFCSRDICQDILLYLCYIMLYLCYIYVILCYIYVIYMLYYVIFMLYLCYIYVTFCYFVLRYFVLEIFAKSTLTHISGTRFFPNMGFKFRKKITTKFFNKFEKPYFWSIFLILRRTSFFSKNLALLRTTSYEFLIPYQNLEKANDQIPRTNRRMI